MANLISLFVYLFSILTYREATVLQAGSCFHFLCFYYDMGVRYLDENSQSANKLITAAM